MADNGSKTEKATPKRRRDERKKGNVFLSQDAIAVLSLFATFGTLFVVGAMFLETLEQFLRECLELAASGRAETVRGNLGLLMKDGSIALIKTAGPLLAASVLAAVAGTFAQTRLMVSGEALKPKFSRISPMQGFKKLFSLKSIVEALKGTLKITVLCIVIYQCLKSDLLNFSKYLYTDLPTASVHLFRSAFNMVMKIGMAFVVLAAFDFIYQWWEYERQLKMSKQEIKEEYKQTEGDPQVKGRIREIQRKMAQTRMMQQVPQADVVIRNPTHFAVALRYRPEKDEAPVVLAKGQDELALRIVRVAEESGVAVIENVPLARGLYAAADLGGQVPPDLYNAVAEVLVYLYRLDGTKSKGPKS